MNYHEDHEKRALNALAEDMASIPSHVVPPCSSEHRDAALGLPLVMIGSDSTNRLNKMIGTTPGPVPSRKEADSLSNVLDAKHKAAIAYARLLRSLTTQEQKDAACDYMACELEVMDLLEGGAA